MHFGNQLVRQRDWGETGCYLGIREKEKRRQKRQILNVHRVILVRYGDLSFCNSS